MNKGDILIPPLPMNVGLCPFCNSPQDVVTNDYLCGYYGYWQYDQAGYLTGAVEIVNPCNKYSVQKLGFWGLAPLAVAKSGIAISTGWPFTYSNELDTIVKVSQPEQHLCTCDSRQLFWGGCVCFGK